MRAFMLLLLIAVGGVGAHGQVTTGDTPDGDAENGRQVFADRGCYQCHGYEAHAGPGSRLAPDPIPFSAFARYVRAPAGQMPPYTGKVLSDTELADIYAFLESIPQPPAVDSIPALRDDR